MTCFFETGGPEQAKIDQSFTIDTALAKRGEMNQLLEYKADNKVEVQVWGLGDGKTYRVLLSMPQSDQTSFGLHSAESDAVNNPNTAVWFDKTFAKIYCQN
jgi:hypothetical protein